MPVKKGTEANAQSIANAFNTDVYNTLMSMVAWYNNSHNLPGQKSQLPLSVLDTKASVKAMVAADIINSNGPDKERSAADLINNVIIPFTKLLSKVRVIYYSEVTLNAWGSEILTYSATNTGILKNQTNINVTPRKIVKGNVMNNADNMNDFITYLYNLLNSNRQNNVFNYKHVTAHTNHYNHSNRGRR